MKKYILIVAVLFLFCSSTYAADDCDSEYKKYMDTLDKTVKISDKQKDKYMLILEKAYSLCQAGKDDEAHKVMVDLKDQFFEDALMNQRDFFGN